KKNAYSASITLEGEVSFYCSIDGEIYSSLISPLAFEDQGGPVSLIVDPEDVDIVFHIAPYMFNGSNEVNASFGYSLDGIQTELHSGVFQLDTSPLEWEIGHPLDKEELTPSNNVFVSNLDSGVPYYFMGRIWDGLE